MNYIILILIISILISRALELWNVLFFFMRKDMANKRSGHLMISDYRGPRPRATPEELQARCRPVRWVGRRSPALPNANAVHKAIAGYVTLQHVL